MPELVPQAVHWWWLDGPCRGPGLAGVDKHQAIYVITERLELRYLWEPHPHETGFWRHIDYVRCPCRYCGQLSPLLYTPANQRERMYIYPIITWPPPSMLVNYWAGETKPAMQEVQTWN